MSTVKSAVIGSEAKDNCFGAVYPHLRSSAGMVEGLGRLEWLSRHNCNWTVRSYRDLCCHSW